MPSDRYNLRKPKKWRPPPEPATPKPPKKTKRASTKAAAASKSGSVKKKTPSKKVAAKARPSNGQSAGPKKTPMKEPKYDPRDNLYFGHATNLPDYDKMTDIPRHLRDEFKRRCASSYPPAQTYEGQRFVFKALYEVTEVNEKTAKAICIEKGFEGLAFYHRYRNEIGGITEAPFLRRIHCDWTFELGDVVELGFMRTR